MLSAAPKAAAVIDLDPALLARVVGAALVRGGDYADVFYERRTVQSFRLQDGKIHEASISSSSGVGVRTVIGEQAGYASTEDLSDKALFEAASVAALIAHDPVRDQREIHLEPRRAASVYHVDGVEPDAISTAVFVDFLERADAAARAFDPRIDQVNASFTAEVQRVTVATSDGVLVTDRRPLLQFGVQAVSKDGERRAHGYYSDGGRTGLGFYSMTTPESIAKEAARISLVNLEAVEAPAGEMPVVVGAGGGGVLLHEAVGHGLESDFNRQGTSLYSGRVGERVASELVTIYDDGDVPGARGSVTVDDEGNPGTHKVLVERGVLRGYMQDRLNSALMGMHSTGSGRRQNFRVMPQPRMCNTYMPSGTSTFEDIVASVDRGLIAKSFSGGQVDISRGDFVFMIAEGYLIENGKIAAPVRGASLIGNGPAIMNNVVAVGNDSRFASGAYTCGKGGQLVPVGVGMPTVKISQLTVGGSRVG